MPQLTVFISEAKGRDDHDEKPITGVNRPAGDIPKARVLIWYRGTDRT